MKKFDKMNFNKGITLIALVITIIILLILAAVTIATLTGENGILNKANDAKSEYTIGEEKEQVSLAYSAGKLKNRGGAVTREQFENELREYEDGATVEQPEGGDFKVTFPKTGHVYTVKKEEISGPEVETGGGIKPGEKSTATVKDNYTDKNGDKATIPEGFTVSEKDNTIDEGLVVIGPDGSEFVWVPVPNAVSTDSEDKPMAKEAVNGDGHYQGVLYRFTSSESFEGPRENETWGQGTGGFSEPNLVTDAIGVTRALYDKEEDIYGYEYDKSEEFFKNILGYDSAQQFGKAMQDDYDNMIKSVIKYKGFYVGRYEMSLGGANEIDVGTGMAQSKKGVKSLGSWEGIASSWYDLYKLARTYKTEENSVVSGMIWGSQWDAMLNWMQKTGKDVTSKTGYNNNKEGISGSVEEDNINEVYDLKGCYLEWAQESYMSGSRVKRGGDYSTGDTNPGLHVASSGKPNRGSSNVCTRLTFYIK